MKKRVKKTILKKISKVKGKKVVVISLGGSVIIPDEIDVKVLEDFKRVLKKHFHKYKFVVVTGGGSIARKYISALKEINASEKLQSLSGISATRMNARFMSYFFNLNPESGIPHTKESVKNYLRKNEIVFCGGLEYKPEQTFDSTAADLASEFQAEFINITNVPGLYDKNPLEHPNAKPILNISWKSFSNLASQIKYQPGQHFVLDYKASQIIMKNKITTYIIGEDMKQLDNLLSKKPFRGSVITN